MKNFIKTYGFLLGFFILSAVIIIASDRRKYTEKELKADSTRIANQPPTRVSVYIPDSTLKKLDSIEKLKK